MNMRNYFFTQEIEAFKSRPRVWLRATDLVQHFWLIEHLLKVL